MPFCSFARITPTSFSVASLPIESTPLFFLGWHLNGVGPLSPPAATTATVRRQGPPVGHRARGTRTTLDFMQKTLHLGATFLATRDSLNEYVRDERGQTWSRTLPVATQPREEPTQASTARRVRSALRQHVANLPALLREQPSQASVPLVSFFWCFRTVLKIMPKGMHTGIKTLDNQ